MSKTPALAAVLVCAAAVAATAGCGWLSRGPAQTTFATPEDAAKALLDVAKAGTLDDLMKILGPDAQPLVDAAEPSRSTARAPRGRL